MDESGRVPTAPWVAEINPGSRGLRRHGVAVLLMLLAQYVMGVGVNLWVKVPEGDAHRGLVGVLRGFVHSPVALAIHAMLGTLLVAAAVAVLVRACRIRSWTSLVSTGLGLLFVVGAWASGAAFVDRGKDYSSFVMAVLTGLATGCYVATALHASRLETARPPEAPGPRCHGPVPAWLTGGGRLRTR